MKFMMVILAVLLCGACFSGVKAVQNLKFMDSGKIAQKQSKRHKRAKF